MTRIGTRLRVAVQDPAKLAGFMVRQGWTVTRVDWPIPASGAWERPGPEVMAELLYSGMDEGGVSVRLRAAMEISGRSASDVARAAECSPATISRLQTISEPKRLRAIAADAGPRIARALHVTPAWLVDGAWTTKHAPLWMPDSILQIRRDADQVVQCVLSSYVRGARWTVDGHELPPPNLHDEQPWRWLASYIASAKAGDASPIGTLHMFPVAFAAMRAHLRRPICFARSPLRWRGIATIGDAIMLASSASALPEPMSTIASKIGWTASGACAPITLPE